MNNKIIKLTNIKPPLGGYTKEERQLEKLLAESTIHTLYNRLPTSRMKFIVAAHFELGYSQSDVAEMLGVSQPSLSDEIAMIQRIFLSKSYVPKKKTTIKIEEMFILMNLLSYL